MTANFAVDDEILEFVKSKGYEIDYIGKPKLVNLPAVGITDEGFSVERTNSWTQIAIVLRKIPKYRDVEIRDIGKTCEFSNYPNFGISTSGILESIGLKKRGSSQGLAYTVRSDDGTTTWNYTYCRILDESDNGPT